jgi:hypothetical protein
VDASIISVAQPPLSSTRQGPPPQFRRLRGSGRGSSGQALTRFRLGSPGFVRQPRREQRRWVRAAATAAPARSLRPSVASYDSRQLAQLGQVNRTRKCSWTAALWPASHSKLSDFLISFVHSDAFLYPMVQEKYLLRSRLWVATSILLYLFNSLKVWLSDWRLVEWSASLIGYREGTRICIKNAPQQYLKKAIFNLSILIQHFWWNCTSIPQFPDLLPDQLSVQMSLVNLADGEALPWLCWCSGVISTCGCRWASGCRTS